MNTRKIEISPDGNRWLPVFMREPADVRPAVDSPPDSPLHEGFVWVRREGRWVPAFDQAALS